MICKKCNTEFDEGIFCPECGTCCESETQKIQEKIEGSNIQLSETFKNNNDGNQYSVDKSNKSKIDKKRKKKERSGVWSLLLGIVSWIGLLTVIVPMVCGLISIVKGISALKNKTKYKKSAIAGIVLSGAVWALLIYVIVQPISDTTPAEDDVTIENSEIVQESAVTLHEETEIDTQQNEDADELKEYEDKLNSYKMIISIYENDVDMEKYELDTDIYIDGERYSSPTFSDYIIITPTLEEGTHEIWLTKTTGKKEKDSNKIKFEVSPLYTNELEIEATLKNKKEFSLKTAVENNVIFEGSESELYKGVEIVRTSNGKEIYYTVEFYVDNTQFINNTAVSITDWLGTEKVARGEDTIAPEPPSIEHYEFIGWSEDISNVSSNLTVFAQYKLIEEDCFPEYIGKYEYKTKNCIDGEEYVCTLDITRVTDVGIYFSFNFMDKESKKEVIIANDFAKWYYEGETAFWHYKEDEKEYYFTFKFYNNEGELAMSIIDANGNTNAENQFGEQYKRLNSK